jgi:hypothetical protein
VQLDHHPNSIRYQQSFEIIHSLCSSTTEILTIHQTSLGQRAKKNSSYLNHSSLLRFQVDNTILGTTILSNEVSHAPGMRLGGVFARRWGWEVVVCKTHFLQSFGCRFKEMRPRS